MPAARVAHPAGRVPERTSVISEVYEGMGLGPAAAALEPGGGVRSRVAVPQVGGSGQGGAERPREVAPPQRPGHAP